MAMKLRWATKYTGWFGMIAMSLTSIPTMEAPAIAQENPAIGAFDHPTTTSCPHSKGSLGVSLAALPATLDRIEVDMKDGRETWTSGPQDLMAAHTNIKASWGSLVERTAGQETYFDGRQYSAHRDTAKDDVKVADGQYVVLVTRSHSAETPSTREETRDCMGEYDPPTLSSRVLTPLAYAPCDGDCSRHTMAKLMDMAFDAPRRTSGSMQGRNEFKLSSDESSTQGTRFIVSSHEVFDADKLTASRIGSDGIPFHPELFRVNLTLRDLKAGATDWSKRMPLVLSIDYVQACPVTDTARECAPDETSSRIQRTFGAVPDLCDPTRCSPENVSKDGDRINKYLKAYSSPGPSRSTLWLAAILVVVGGGMGFVFMRRRIT